MPLSHIDSPLGRLRLYLSQTIRGSVELPALPGPAGDVIK